MVGRTQLGTVEVVDPSVITLNGIAASHAANTILLAAVGLLEGEEIDHKLFFPAEDEVRSIVPRRDPSPRPPYTLIVRPPSFLPTDGRVAP